MKYFFALFILFSTNLFSQDYKESLPTYDDYKKYCGKPLTDKFSNIESVKVVYDLSSKKLYFFDSKKIELHYLFVNNFLNYDLDLQSFNARNYGSSETERDFLLGNLNHIKGSEKWIFELAASDHMTVNQIQFLYNLISKNTFIDNKLKFYLNNREKLDWQNEGKFKIPCVSSEYIFNDLSFQQVVEGETVGILKKYSLKDLETITPKWNEIIVVDGTPEILPSVKAIIVSELQTPLSHLIILGKNRKIPIMAYTKVMTDLKFKAFENEKVSLKIAVDTFFIAKTDKKIIENKIAKKKQLQLNLTVKNLVDLSKINKKGASFMGSKAQNLSYLIAIAKGNTNFKVPENAWGIPFYFYKEHVSKNKEILNLISELLKYPHKDSINWKNNQLKKIRNAIKLAPINQDLITKLNLELGKQSQFKNFRFRSSTNAEDIDGFNGAGLYESKTGILNDKTKTFEKAIKQVWASVWNESSYWERELFGIDQNNIAMGLLVHRAFPDELANGVIVSKNMSRGEFTGITVNVQKGENSVVKPEKGVVCEQFTVYDFDLFTDNNANAEVDYISQSNLNENKPLLSIAEINNLYRVTRKIQQKINGYWGTLSFKAIDIEFKIVGEKRELYIKQARVFND